MAVFQDAVDATFAAFGTDAVYTPAGGEPVQVRVIARRAGYHRRLRRDLRRPRRAGAARSRPARVQPGCEAGMSEPVSPLQMASPAGIGGDTAIVIQAPASSPSATFATLHR
jgi:hypothetical protein